MNRWWVGHPGEHYWMEVTDRPDIGTDLNAPALNEKGRPQWSYDLIKEADDGDVVFHFSKPEESIVGLSMVRDEAWADEVVWGAKGTSARGNLVKPYPRPGFRRGLQHHERFRDVVTLDEVRAVEDRVFEIRDSLQARFRGSLYFPFVPYKGKPLRTFQGYMVKMPAELVTLLGLPEVPATPTSLDRRGAPPFDLQAATALRGAVYRRADEAVAVSVADPQPIDPALMERGLKSHRRLQNDLADLLRSSGREPLSPASADPDWDIAWRDDGVFCVAEVKSITDGNEERQLRLGLGQVLRYRQRLQLSEPQVRAILVIERAPADLSWAELCGEVGVQLTWPADWEVLLPRLHGRSSLPDGEQLGLSVD